jgi:hypothetical protein
MRMLWQAGIKIVYARGFYSDFEKCSSMLDLELDVDNIGDFKKITIKPRLGNQR